MEKQKTIIRLAGNIRDSFFCLQTEQYIQAHQQLSEYLKKLKELEKESSLFGKAVNKNWFGAAKVCSARSDRLLNDISYSLQRIKELTSKEQLKLPDLATIVDEITQLKDEFEKAEFNIEENFISVTTEPINLEGIYFGPFEIRLCLDKLCVLYKDSPYYVIALDPNPAATASEVTHPHVSGEKVCEGDGYTAIRAALQQGRLTDFFTMVRTCK